VSVNSAQTEHRGIRVGYHPTVRHAVETLLLEERTRWAMQIHDGLTQSVTSAVLELQTLRHRIEDDPTAAIAALTEIEDEIRADLRRIRELLFEMTTTTPALAEPTITALVRDATDRWQLEATVEIDGVLDGIPEEVLEAGYAIITEGLANAAKHSGAPAARVRVRTTESSLLVEVQDRGRGIAAIVGDDPHFGLRVMQARAEALGGALDIESAPGRGTTLTAVLPVGPRGER
jgi:signal transduction histidine kinase